MTSRPAPTSSVKASAISATTRPLPKRRPAPLAVRVSPSRTAAASSRSAERDERPDSAEHADAERDDRREREHAPVDRDGGRARQLAAGEGDERADDPRREQHAERAAGGGEQHAFHGELARQVARPGAEREADGQFAAPRHARGEQQARDVRAGDQQEEEHGAEQHLERRAHAADDGFGVRADVDAVVVAELARQRVAERAHLGRGARAP